MPQTNDPKSVLADRVGELLDGIAAGDQQAMAELYRNFGAMIARNVLRLVKDSAVAEEVVQDTMYEIWRNPRRFRGESSFSTFVIAIAHHKALTARRSSARDRRVEVVADDCLLKIMDEVAGPDLDPSDEVGQKHLQRDVQRCIGKLPEIHGECLHLVYALDLSIEEVARIQNCPPNTVKTRMFHARQKIKNCLRLVLQGAAI
ncbi:MAG: sigma-70 family RNA polymerase sigma factor [Gammaproteobacteria bacterium]|nr:sigma-70 family RNA polymerase sigma factor [Gammaproteobacteria bacterium]